MKLYTVVWRYEQKETAPHRADGMTWATVGELLRLLSNDNESNRAYVKISVVLPNGVPQVVPLLVASKELNRGYPFPYLADEVDDT